MTNIQFQPSLSIAKSVLAVDVEDCELFQNKMRWQDVKHKTFVFTSSAQSRKIRKSIPPLVPMLASTPRQQETHISPSGADDELPMEIWNVPKTPSLQGGQNGVDSFTALDTQSRTETAVEQDESGLDFEFLDWGFNSALTEEPPVPYYCCPTALKRKSTPPEAPRLFQSNDNKRRKSCNLDTRYGYSRSQSPKLLEAKSTTTQNHEITTGSLPTNPMSIRSLLEEPEQQATVEFPLFVPFDKGNDGVNASSSVSTWTGEFSSAVFETSNNQAVTSLGTDFDKKPELWDEAPSVLFESVWDEWLDIDLLPSPEKLPVLHTDIEIGEMDSNPGYVFQDTILHQSAPLPILSDKLSIAQPWDPISRRRDPSEQVPTRSIPPELSPASATSSTPESFDSQHRSSAIRHRKSARGEPRYPCPINHCPRHGDEEGFHRKDHLVQHLRTLHSLRQEDLVPGFCPHKDCQYSEGPSGGFRVFSIFREYSRHLKNDHKESLFNCSVPGCRREGANGYSGQANLLRHVKRRHPRWIDKVIADQDYSFAYLANI